MSHTTPYWLSSVAAPSFPALNRALDVDVVVIGGGITGLTAAYLLKQSGRTVAVLDRGRCGQGESGHTTAHLTCVTDVRLSDLVGTFGRDHAQAAWDAGLAAITQIEGIVRREHIDCDFARVPGYLHAPVDDVTESEVDRLRHDAILAQELGFGASFDERLPFVKTPGVRIDHQARVHPQKYLAALVARIDGDGSHVHEHTQVEAVAEDATQVTAGGIAVRCRHVVIATHNPIAGASTFLNASLRQTKLALYSTYAVAARVPRGTVPDALFWDTGNPYRYLRITPDREGDLAILGGEDHKTGQTDDTRAAYERLEQALGRAVPGVTIAHRWSGQVIETADGLPYIGESAPRQFIATGFAGNGITFGTLAGIMAADAVAGRRNPWTDLFAVDRTKILGATWDYVKENADYPFYLLRDRLRRPTARTLSTLAPGDGAVLDLNGQRTAASRREDGSVVLCSAICTHLGCVVHWNAAEHTWDCPCHGSRFSPAGEVIAGPAQTPLSRIEQETQARKRGPSPGARTP